jgi:hypothetical protein
MDGAGVEVEVIVEVAEGMDSVGVEVVEAEPVGMDGDATVTDGLNVSVKIIGVGLTTPGVREGMGVQTGNGWGA